MIEALSAAGPDESVRVILISGAGDHFCAGFDIVGRNAGDERPRVGSIQRRLPTEAHRLIELLLTTQTPVVCQVQGWAAGIGLHLALAADFAVVDEAARLWEPYAQRGFTPDTGGTWLLPRRIGEVRAREMLLLGEAVSGADAAAWGMVHRAVPGDALAGEVQALVQPAGRGAHGDDRAHEVAAARRRHRAAARAPAERGARHGALVAQRRLQGGARRVRREAPARVQGPMTAGPAGGAPGAGRLAVGPDTPLEDALAAVRAWVEACVPPEWVAAGRRGGPAEVRTVRTRARVRGVVPRVRGVGPGRADLAGRVRRARPVARQWRAGSTRSCGPSTSAG